MSFPLFLLTLTTVIGLSVGQILFKLAAEAMNGVGPFWLSIARNVYLLIALVVYGLVHRIVDSRPAPGTLATGVPVRGHSLCAGPDHGALVLG
jgi:hypothetical protein